MLPADCISILVNILLKDIQRYPDGELARYLGGVAKCGGDPIIAQVTPLCNTPSVKYA